MKQHHKLVEFITTFEMYESVRHDDENEYILKKEIFVITANNLRIHFPEIEVIVTCRNHR